MKRKAFISACVALVGFGAAVCSWDGMFRGINSWIVLFSGGLSALLIGGISAAVFAWLSGQEAELARGSALAHWTYTTEEWRAFVEREKQTNAASKWMLLRVIVGFCALFGVGFLVFDADAGRWVALVMAGLAALMTVVTIVSLRAAERRLQTQSDVLIAKSGVLIAGEYTCWTMLGATLDRVTLFPSAQPMVLEFGYSIPNPRTDIRQTYEVRIPVPASAQASLDEIAHQLGVVMERVVE